MDDVLNVDKAQSICIYRLPKLPRVVREKLVVIGIFFSSNCDRKRLMFQARITAFLRVILLFAVLFKVEATHSRMYVP